MTTYAQFLPTSLYARLFTVAWTVALLTATMRTAAKKLTTKLRAAHFVEVARLVFQRILPTETRLDGKKWAYGTAFVISMAIVGYLWMAAVLCPFTFVSAGRGLCPAR